jgi:tetratricopeptide (TPR) repeat protein
MKRLLSWCLCVALFGINAPLWSQPKSTKKVTPEQKAEQVTKQGQEQFIKGNYDAALKLFLEAANLDPKTTDYLFNAGLCHNKLGEASVMRKNTSKAIEDYQSAIDIFQSLLVKIPESNKELRGRVEKSLISANQKQAELKSLNDQDKDGIANDLDLCPNDAGTALTKGCPDQDLDAISDRDDLCPKESGDVATKGCPDQDGDLIADKDDACPKESGTAETKGCAILAGALDNKRKEPSDKKIHKALFVSAAGLGATSLVFGAVGLLQIRSGNNEIADQQLDTFAAKFAKGLRLGYIADGLAVGAVVCAGVGFILRPKKTAEKAALVLSPNTIGVMGSF